MTLILFFAVFIPSLTLSPPPPSCSLSLSYYSLISKKNQQKNPKNKKQKNEIIHFRYQELQSRILELPVSGARPLVAASGYMSRAIGYRPCFDRVHVPHVASFYCLHFCVLQNIRTLGYIRRLLWNWDLF